MSEVLLPIVPSELLTIALNDLKKTIKAGITINMDTWGRQVGTPECSVCFAGAVMLNTGNLKKDIYGQFDATESMVNIRQYHFLDCVRQGSLWQATKQLRIKHPNKYLEFSNEIYGWKEFGECTNEEFFKQIEDLIEFFKEYNL